jgi:hypothetical protein
MQTYKSGYIGPTGHAFVFESAADLKLHIRQGGAVDFGRRSPGSAAIVAEMSWPSPTKARFEGLNGIETVELQNDESRENFELRVLNAWLSFTGQQRRQDELDAAAMRAPAATRTQPV